MKRLLFKAPLLAVTLSLCIGSACWGQSEKLSVDLQGANVPAELDVIIQYKQAPTSADHQKVIAKGGMHRNTFNSIKAGLYHVRASMVAGSGERSQRSLHFAGPDGARSPRPGAGHHRRERGQDATASPARASGSW